MIDEMMNLRVFVISFAARRLMELEVEGQTGAAYGEKSAERLAQRNGHCAVIDDKVKAFLTRPIDGDWPVSVDRCHLSEGAPAEAHRLGRGDCRGRRQQ
jgi:hypothetical protein